MRITRVDSGYLYYTSYANYYTTVRQAACAGTGRVKKKFNVPHYCREPTVTIIVSTEMR